jgi:hypothetical protein
MSAFLQLPAELVEYVFVYLAQPDLYTVCRLNKSLHALATPFLYRNVDLYIRGRKRIPRIDRFCMNVIKNQRIAARVESIRLGISPDEAVEEFIVGMYDLRASHAIYGLIGTHNQLNTLYPRTGTLMTMPCLH